MPYDNDQVDLPRPLPPLLRQKTDPGLPSVSIRPAMTCSQSFRMNEEPRDRRWKLLRQDSDSSLKMPRRYPEQPSDSISVDGTPDTNNVATTVSRKSAQAFVHRTQAFSSSTTALDSRWKMPCTNKQNASWVNHHCKDLRLGNLRRQQQQRRSCHSAEELRTIQRLHKRHQEPLQTLPEVPSLSQPSIQRTKRSKVSFIPNSILMDYDALMIPKSERRRDVTIRPDTRNGTRQAMKKSSLRSALGMMTPGEY